MKMTDDADAAAAASDVDADADADADAPGVTHFGAYHCPSDGHF